MAKKQVCKKCRAFVQGTECQVCKGNQLSTNWKGRLHISDPEKSGIAKKIGIDQKGEYAIKVS